MAGQFWFGKYIANTGDRKVKPQERVAAFSIGGIYPAQNGGHSICVTGISGGRLEFIHGRRRGDGVSGGVRSAPLQVADDGVEFVEDIFLFYRADDIGKPEKTTPLLWRYTKNGRRRARKEAGQERKKTACVL